MHGDPHLHYLVGKQWVATHKTVDFRLTHLLLSSQKYCHSFGKDRTMMQRNIKQHFFGFILGITAFTNSNTPCAMRHALTHSRDPYATPLERKEKT